MNERAIRDRLVEHGKTLFARRKEPIAFTGTAEADAMLNDLEGCPHAFVLACVMDRQIKAERAWLIPYRVSQRLGGFAIDTLSSLSLSQIRRLMSNPEPLHRFVEIMSGNFYSAIQLISKRYDGDASLIWSDEPSSAEVVYRFLEFDGVGPKIGSMAVNILARDFKVPLADYFSIDISPDVHVKRVLARLGLAPDNASPEQIIYKARALHPEFPGMMDFPAFEIGRNWCRPRALMCEVCYMQDLCPTAQRPAALG